MDDATPDVPEEPRPPGDNMAPESVDALGPGSTGRRLVRTRGSEHLFDLDAATYRRTPGPGHGRFPHDGHTVKLTRVVRWPRVGETFLIWVDDHELPELIEHWHQSSPVESITRVGTDHGD